jgi:hypothetical protein
MKILSKNERLNRKKNDSEERKIQVGFLIILIQRSIIRQK